MNFQTIANTVVAPALLIAASVAPQWATHLTLESNLNTVSFAEPKNEEIHAMDSTAEPKMDTRVLSESINIDGLDIFYREAGSQQAPTILWLYGFPTSLHMFRELMPRLANDYHLIAPDYTG